MNIEQLNELLSEHGIRVIGTYAHSKASEAYIEIVITTSANTTWDGAVPYVYPRAGRFLDTEAAVADYLLEVKDHFEPDNIRRWAEREWAYWEENYSKARVTTPFFQRLISMEWVYANEFPANPNPQRRIQDIKDKGYTVASKQDGNGWKRKLLPLPREADRGYETIPSELRSRILELLDFENAYELSTANRQGILPDHKFPEIRWDAETRAENQVDMPDEDIRSKFQLLDNQRNQQKREVCRRCFQTGERGTPFGINFFYAGGSTWDNAIPQTGAAAEQGCVGCGWYDLAAWRTSLNAKLAEPQE